MAGFSAKSRGFQNFGRPEIAPGLMAGRVSDQSSQPPSPGAEAPVRIGTPVVRLPLTVSW